MGGRTNDGKRGGICRREDKRGLVWTSPFNLKILFVHPQFSLFLSQLTSLLLTKLHQGRMLLGALDACKIQSLLSSHFTVSIWIWFFHAEQLVVSHAMLLGWIQFTFIQVYTTCKGSVTSGRRVVTEFPSQKEG